MELENKKHNIPVLALFVCLLGLIAIHAGLARAEGESLVQVDPPTVNSAAATHTLSRDLEPVVVNGQVVPQMTGLPIEELFVYVYSGSDWTQIPAQIDEITASGAYTTTEDGLLDVNDQIAFMARDLGDLAPDEPLLTISLPISDFWYELQVTDPLSPTQQAWAYLVHSTVLTTSFTDNYVDYNLSEPKITGENYSFGLAIPAPWADTLTLGAGPDILDRSKIRLYCQYNPMNPLTWFCPLNEELATQFGLELEDNLIADGPVRVIVQGGLAIAYGQLMSWYMAIPEMPSFLAGDMRFSLDFDPVVTGATFYNAVAPDGVTVDGLPDAIPSQPFSPWYQLSTQDGTLIQVAETSSVGGIQSNYYRDDQVTDDKDTGDQMHYGDTGVYVADPNASFEFAFNLYSLPGEQPNRGETFQAYFENPLAVTGLLHEDRFPEKVYLPLVVH